MLWGLWLALINIDFHSSKALFCSEPLRWHKETIVLPRFVSPAHFQSSLQRARRASLLRFIVHGLKLIKSQPTDLDRSIETTHLPFEFHVLPNPHLSLIRYQTSSFFEIQKAVTKDIRVNNKHAPDRIRFVRRLCVATPMNLGYTGP